MDREVKEKGLTLIELLVVIGIVSLLLSIAVPAFNSWRVKASIEGDTQDIYALLQKARAMAFSQKRELWVIANGTRVCINDGAADIDCLRLSNPFNGTVQISERGTFSNNSIFYTGSWSGNPAFNCVVTSVTRARLGVYDGANCNPR